MKSPYRYIYRNGARLTEHKFVAELALGKPLPPKALVHHVNENQRDNRNENLVICEDIAYHKLLHFRMRLIEMGIDPDKEFSCSDCRSVKPLEEFRRHKGRPNGRANICAACRSIRDRARIRTSAQGAKSYHERVRERHGDTLLKQDGDYEVLRPCRGKVAL